LYNPASGGDKKYGMNPPAVEVANVTKTYRVGHTDYPALRGVSFKIEKGNWRR
jgi:ABC-type glutathione transport system ATPase component